MSLALVLQEHNYSKASTEFIFARIKGAGVDGIDPRLVRVLEPVFAKVALCQDSRVRVMKIANQERMVYI